jgi:hypothetical protein
MPGVAIEHYDQPQADEISPDRFNRKTLPRRVTANSAGVVWYRSDYELRYLRVAKLCRCKVTAQFKRAAKAGDVAEMLACSRELREWCERERALLRIAKPAAQVIKVGKHADRLDRDVTPTMVDVEQVSPEQPK